MVYLLNRDVPITWRCYERIIDKMPELLVPVLDHMTVVDERIFFIIARKGCRPSMKLLLDKGFAIDPEAVYND